MSEYDETQLFPDMRLARLLLERLGKTSLSVSIEVAALKIVEAQATIAEQGAEIARLNRLIDLADIPNSVGSLNPVFPKKRTPPMTDTALIERAKQTVKIIEGNYDRHVDLFSIDMQEFGVIHEMLEALEQSEWVSVDEVVVNKKYLKVVYRASSPIMSLDDNWREAYDYISAVLYE